MDNIKLDLGQICSEGGRCVELSNDCFDITDVEPSGSITALYVIWLAERDKYQRPLS